MWAGIKVSRCKLVKGGSYHPFMAAKCDAEKAVESHRGDQNNVYAVLLYLLFFFHSDICWLLLQSFLAKTAKMRFCWPTEPSLYNKCIMYIWINNVIWTNKSNNNEAKCKGEFKDRVWPEGFSSAFITSGLWLHWWEGQTQHTGVYHNMLV